MAENGSQQEKKQKGPLQSGYQFRTFQGVFTPSLLTILGVIMYLRFGWVLGNVGLTQTLLIVTLSTGITFLTGLSISALATNMRVGGGGAYYIISRSLGVEAGAAIGIPLYFAKALGVAFYIFGFAESLQVLFPFIPIKIIAVATLIGLTFISYRSADLALKSQYIILGCIVLSLISFFFGHAITDPVPIGTMVPERVAFWLTFAVFFPAVTGIEAGLSMSGDLKEPAKSLPLGTFAAILISYIIYMAIPVFMDNMVSDKNLFLTNSFIMKDIAAFAPLIVIGVLGASLSSALGALLGAPRTLQAIAKDKVVPQFLGKGDGEENEPRVALAVSFIVALIGILKGNLNLIAPILSMFFLTTYGLLNLAAALEGMIGSATWRPKFRVHWGFPLAGAFSCFAAMFMINPGATFIALIVSFMVFLYMKKKQVNTNWKDTRYGILLLLLQYGIYRLEIKKPTERTWRPNILVLSGPPTSRWGLIELADAITHQRGFLTVSTVVDEKSVTKEREDNIKDTIRNYLTENNVKALVNIHPAGSPMEGAKELITTYGFGTLHPNTIIIGDTEREEKFVEFSELILTAHSRKRNLVILRNVDEFFNADEEVRIEVLWGGARQNAGLMFTLAYMIKTSPKWSRVKLTIKTIIEDEGEREEVEDRLNDFLKQQRIKADVAVIVKDSADVFETITKELQGASFCLLGMKAPEEGQTAEEYSEYYKVLLEKTKNLPPAMLVLASEDIDFHRIVATDF